MSLPPADWYVDPNDASFMQFWDGSRWTEHRRPVVPAHAPAPTPPRSRRKVKVLVAALSIVVVAAGAGTIWYFLANSGEAAISPEDLHASALSRSDLTRVFTQDTFLAPTANDLPLKSSIEERLDFVSSAPQDCWFMSSQVPLTASDESASIDPNASSVGQSVFAESGAWDVQYRLFESTDVASRYLRDNTTSMPKCNTPFATTNGITWVAEPWLADGLPVDSLSWSTRSVDGGSASITTDLMVGNAIARVDTLGLTDEEHIILVNVVRDKLVASTSR